MTYLFDVPAFFVVFRETLEVVIILSVMIGFIDKMIPNDKELNKAMKRQVWIGTLAGFALSAVIATVFIIVFYTVGKKNLWKDSEPAWEGAFSLIACVVITIMAFSMIRVTQWKKKWESKLAQATQEYLDKHEKGKRWALVVLPFTVVMREALESIVFIAGIGYDEPASGLPIPVITGLIAGCAVGWIIYRGSHRVSLEVFFGIMTTLLFFIAAGLLSTSIHELQEATDKGDEEGDEDEGEKGEEGKEEEGVLWHLSCCDPNTNEGWNVAKTLFGWTNKATLGPTVGYFVYWAAVLCGLAFIRLRAKRQEKELSDLEMPEHNQVDEPSEKDGHTIA